MSTWAHDGRLVPADDHETHIALNREYSANHFRPQATWYDEPEGVPVLVGQELVERAARGVPLGPLEAVVACNWILEHRAEF